LEIELLFRYLSKYTIVEIPGMNVIFKALNDPTRRAILELLQQKDMTAGEIADRFQISFPSISHHLDVLKQAKLVVSEKEGQFVYYSLNTTVVDEILKWLLQFKQKKK
jgi:ArsR family transcriptional regulator, arsenate/arsenite/antimonite-responsive transcriptional repressor